jgi:carbamate kinase
VKLHVDMLVFSTDADYVYLNYRKPNQQALIRVSSKDLRAHLAAGQFPPGNMGPKIESALRFLEAGGREVIITSQEHLYEAIQGRAGTCIAGRPA